MPVAILDRSSPGESDKIKLLLLAEGFQLASLSPEHPLRERLIEVKPRLCVLVSASPREALQSIRQLRSDAAGRPLILCVHTSPWAEGPVQCIDAGADDFLGGPVHPQVFIARVRALLRRGLWSGRLDGGGETVLRAGPIMIEVLARKAFVRDRIAPLTRLEFDLLDHLMRHPGRVLSRRDLLQAVWHHPEDADDVDTRTVDKHVESLRSKLGAPASVLQTVRGSGYLFSGESPAGAGRK